MDSSALLLFSWQTDDGKKRGIFLVDEEERTGVEFCWFDYESEEWRTVEDLGSLRDIESYSIPNSFLAGSD